MTERSREERILASAAWAAFGDAAGFMTEMANEERLHWRTGAMTVTSLVPWRRRVGGRFGADVEMPAGCYSDDTQLRLATSRSIAADGTFDIESFSKIELPVFLAYSLGAGKGTKQSAANLRKGSSSWSSNFSKSYVDGGGNGAAMRIQPHVWSAGDATPINGTILDVARNTICTHGHPRALVGAVFHALLLEAALHGRAVGPTEWSEALQRAASLIPTVLSDDFHFSTLWLPEWRRVADGDYLEAVGRTIGECRHLLERANQCASDSREPESAYRSLLVDAGGFDPKTRGSGTKTAILAAAHAWLFRDAPRRGILAAANLLRSDTDTIASMSGALLGAASGVVPQDEVTDASYIASEALRLAAVRAKRATKGFVYPNLLDWSPPRSSLDAVGMITPDEPPLLSGIGDLRFESSEYSTSGRNPFVMRWARLQFGQTVLARMRPEPVKLARSRRPAGYVAVRSTHTPMRSTRSDRSDGRLRQDARGGSPQPAEHVMATSRAPTLDSLIQAVVDSDLDPTVVGRGLIAAACGPRAIEHSVAFAAMVAREQLTRQRRGRSRSAGRQPELQLEPAQVENNRPTKQSE